MIARARRSRNLAATRVRVLSMNVIKESKNRHPLNSKSKHLRFQQLGGFGHRSRFPELC